MTEHYSEERRNFLKTIVVLGGSAAALSAGKTVGRASKKLPIAPDTSEKRYKETDHIRKYYQTAKS